MNADDPRHGTLNGYQNLRCRCDRCRAANSAYNKEYRHRTGRSIPMADWVAIRPTRRHGSRSAYTKGCRCDLCREAERVSKAAYRARLRSEASA